VADDDVGDVAWLAGLLAMVANEDLGAGPQSIFHTLGTKEKGDILNCLTSAEGWSRIS